LMLPSLAIHTLPAPVFCAALMARSTSHCLKVWGRDSSIQPLPALWLLVQIPDVDGIGQADLLSPLNPGEELRADFVELGAHNPVAGAFGLVLHFFVGVLPFVGFLDFPTEARICSTTKPTSTSAASPSAIASSRSNVEFKRLTISWLMDSSAGLAFDAAVSFAYSVCGKRSANLTLFDAMAMGLE
jgi:hypothetical protein